MDDLLKKLNTLVSAQLNDLASKIPIPSSKSDLTRQATDLRERVNAAMAHEEQLRANINALREEIAALSARVDAALQDGQDSTARALLEQMQRLEKRLGFAEADLRQHHHHVTQLMEQVSAFENIVQRAQPPRTPPIHAVPDAIPAQADAAPADDAIQAAPQANADAAQAAPAAAPKPKPKAKRDPSAPYTAKDLAQDARQEAEQQLERTESGMQNTGGLLRDIQARAKARMDELDRILRDGGLIDDPESAAARKAAEDDIEARLKRLSKPD